MLMCAHYHPRAAGCYQNGQLPVTPTGLDANACCSTTVDDSNSCTCIATGQTVPAGIDARKACCSGYATLNAGVMTCACKEDGQVPPNRNAGGCW